MYKIQVAGVRPYWSPADAESPGYILAQPGGCGQCQYFSQHTRQNMFVLGLAIFSIYKVLAMAGNGRKAG